MLLSLAGRILEESGWDQELSKANGCRVDVQHSFVPMLSLIRIPSNKHHQFEMLCLAYIFVLETKSQEVFQCSQHDFLNFECFFFSFQALFVANFAKVHEKTQILNEDWKKLRVQPVQLMKPVSGHPFLKQVWKGRGARQQ